MITTKRATTRRETAQEDAFHVMQYQQQQQWALYYGNTHYPADGAAAAHSPVDENTNRQQTEINGDTGEANSKRQRVD